MQAGRQARRYTHRYAKVDISDVRKWVQQCARQHVCIPILSSTQGFVSEQSRVRCQRVYQLAREYEHQQNPGRCQDSDDPIQRQVANVAQYTPGPERLSDDIGCHKERETVEGGTE